jgi:hypothetical protein
MVVFIFIAYWGIAFFNVWQRVPPFFVEKLEDQQIPSHVCPTTWAWIGRLDTSVRRGEVGRFHAPNSSELLPMLVAVYVPPGVA